MSEIKIGFEYEGFGEQCIRDHMIPKSLKRVVDGRIYKPRSDWNDGYDVLTELRFKPIDKHMDLIHIFQEYKLLVDYLVEAYSVEFAELKVAKVLHARALDNLDKTRVNDETLESRKRRNFVGEYINYDFKHPMTIEGHELKSFVLDPDDRFRGGGLHINISPVDPKKASILAMLLDKRLRPLQNYPFKSKYRTNLLFRYRDYDGVIGMEYMSMGIDSEGMGDKEFVYLFKQIFDITVEEAEKIQKVKP